MRRREFIVGLGSAAASAALPLATSALQRTLPVIGSIEGSVG
jgi:hypothetical protein